MFTMTLLLVYYLNFKLGSSQDPALAAQDHEVRDRDYFFIWSFSAWGVWAATRARLRMGIARGVGRHGATQERQDARRPSRRAEAG